MLEAYEEEAHRHDDRHDGRVEERHRDDHDHVAVVEAELVWERAFGLLELRRRRGHELVGLLEQHLGAAEHVEHSSDERRLHHILDVEGRVGKEAHVLHQLVRE